MKLGALAPNRLALGDSQAANLWMYGTNRREYMNEEGIDQPKERPGKLGN